MRLNIVPNRWSIRSWLSDTGISGELILIVMQVSRGEVTIASRDLLYKHAVVTAGAPGIAKRTEQRDLFRDFLVTLSAPLMPSRKRPLNTSFSPVV